MFFDETAKFISNMPWFTRTIVTSDDEKILEKAQTWEFESVRRPHIFAKSDSSIRSTFEHLFSVHNFSPDDILWLFYLPIVYKDPKDFEAARLLIEYENCNTVIGMQPASCHPFSCWEIDHNGTMRQFIKNDVYRRQDLSEAWTYHHYICSFRFRVFNSLNSELIGPETHPFQLPEKTLSNLIEIDTPADLERWNKLMNTPSRS